MSRSTLIVFTVSILLIIAVGALMMNLFSENRMNESSSVISGLKINLPPDPGEVGKLTLQGVDSDEDGVRDDVQWWIGLNITSEKERRALLDIAKATQSALVASGEAELQVALAANLASGRCLFFISSGSISAHEHMQAVDDPVLNTQLRIDAYRVYKNQLNPAWFDSPDPNDFAKFCSFDPATLPN